MTCLDLGDHVFVEPVLVSKRCHSVDFVTTTNGKTLNTMCRFFLDCVFLENVYNTEVIDDRPGAGLR